MQIPNPRISDWRLWAVLLSGCVLFLGFTGVVARLDRELLFRLFDLDYEKNFPTFFSTALLFANAVIVYRLKRLNKLNLWGGALAIVFCFMGCDELIRIHERAERLIEIDFQILFLPLIILAAVGWFQVLFKAFPNPLTALLWIGGAVAWGSSQILEAAAWGWWLGADKPADGYVVMMITEELLEMSGSLLFLLALLRFQSLGKSTSRSSLPKAQAEQQNAAWPVSAGR